MKTERSPIVRTTVVSMALVILAAILFMVTWRTTGSKLWVSLVAGWCVLFVIVPTLVLRRMLDAGVLNPPGRRLMVLSWAGLALFTLCLAGFEIVTGAAPGSWGLTLVATLGFLGAALTARREFN